MSKLLLHIIKPVTFVMTVVVVLLGVSFVLAPKDNTEGSGINNPNAHGFYSEPENSIDVAVIGNSDAYSGFSPMELWNEFGYTSYVGAEGRQLIDSSVAMLQKMLTCQSPKVVILEVDGLFTKTDITDTFVGIFNSVAGEKLSVFQYHDRWKKLKLSEMFKRPAYTAHCITKGQKLSNEVIPYTGGEYMIETDDIAKMPESSKRGLERFADICRKNGAELLLVELPSESSWNWSRHNSVAAWADKNGVPFLDLNIDRDEFDFDWTKDTRDGGNHLNNSGARKATLYIGKYLSENYNLSDRRADDSFAIWKSDYESYKKDAKI